MLSFECIKNEKSVYFLLTSATGLVLMPVDRSPVQPTQFFPTGCPKPSAQLDFSSHFGLPTRNLITYCPNFVSHEVVS